MIGAIPISNAMEYDRENIKLIILTMISQFFFFIAITIPFDVFDVEKDKMKTLATTMGIKKAIIVAKICLALHVLIAIAKDPSSNEIIGHLVIAGIAFTILSLYKKLLHHRTLQYYCVDGLIILQTFIIYFLH